MKRRDDELTAAMYATGVFEDKKKRSYIANWLHPGTGHRCEYLFGEDKTARRRQIFDRDKGKCQLETFLCKGYQGWDYGEWHHAEGGRGRQHCDCLENGLWSCGPCHRAMHVRPRWTRREREAVKCG